MPRQRFISIILLVVGVALLIAGITRIAPAGTTPLGVGLAFFGALLFGLSFIPRPQPAADAPAPLSPAERVLGIFYEPGRVFQNLRTHPRWLAAFFVIAICTALYSVAFVQRMTPEAIANKMSDKIIESGWIPAENIPSFREEQLAGIAAPVARVAATTNAAVGLFALMAFFAALYLLGVLMFGGRINFWQALAVAFYATLPVVVIQKLLSLLLLYLKDRDDINLIIDQSGLVRDNLGVLFSPARHPVLFVAASFIGVLSFYGVWLTATGLRNTGERVSSGAAWTIALTLWLLGMVFSVVWGGLLFPNFLS